MDRSLATTVSSFQPKELTVAMQTKLEALEATDLRHCLPLLHAVIDGLKRRFSNFLELKYEANEAILAILTHPYFKRRWLPNKFVEEHRRFQQLLVSGTDQVLLEAMPLVPAK